VAAGATASVVPVIKAIRCTKCGGSLDLRSPDTRTIVCRYCAAQLDLTSPDFAFLEALRKQPLATPLHVGDGGTIDQIPYQIAGVIGWQDGDASWEDYFLVGPEGRTAWIRYDHFAYLMFRVFKPLGAAPIHMQTVDPGSHYVDFENGYHMVLDRKRAKVVYLEGELPWRVRMGEELVLLRCEGLSVEISPAQVRYFHWSVVPWQNLAEAFGLADEVVRPDAGPVFRQVPLGMDLFYGTLIVFAFGFIVSAAVFESCPPPPKHGGIVDARRRLGLHDAPLRTLKP
jgi:hypothetical protein